MPLVSVIVPVYNVAVYLRRCLDSIRNQTFSDWECLLIDDGSTDNSGLICDEYCLLDSRFIVYHINNGGVAAARQLGTKQAKGKYSIHIDSDDWVEPQMLYDMVVKISSGNYDILITDYYSQKDGVEKKHIQKPFNLSNNNSIIKEMLAGNMRGFLWNKLILHSLYSNYNIEYVQGVNYGEDMLICIQLLKAPVKVGYHSKAYYHYCVNSDGITSSYNSHTFDMRKQYIDAISQMLPSNKWGGVICTCAYRIKIEALYANVLTKEDFYNFCPPELPQFLSVRRPDVLPFALFAYFGFYDIGITVYKWIHNIGKRLIRKIRR